MLLSLVLAAIAPAHALVDLRLTGGGGVSAWGPAGRIGLDGEVWFGKHWGIGARVAGGLDGTSPLVVLGPQVPIRLLGGKTVAWIVEPGLGVAADLDVNQNALLNLGVFTGVQAKLLFLSGSAGIRLETYGFQDSAATLELGFGLGI